MYRLLVILLFYNSLHAQTLGGNSIFNFLRLPNTPQLTGLGGINVSQVSDDVGMVFHNPSLLNKEMDEQLNVVFNSFYSDIKVYHVSGALYHEKWNTSFSGGLNFFDYGKVAQTDPSGNILGKFHPVDWVLQVSAARNYLEKWSYGSTLKFISSNYGQYRSSGIALDVGVLYRDSSAGLSASIVAKNMGTQIKKYDGVGSEELPFDLQAGITKRLKHAPFSFSLTAQKLQFFDIRYHDPVFNDQNGINTPSGGIGKVLDHLVFASTVYIGNKVEVYGGYNFLRRRELNTGNISNGLNGFSMGVGALFDKLEIRYARAYYQASSAYNQFGLNIKLDKLGDFF